MLSEAELAHMEQAARDSATFPWVRGYLLALLAEVRRLRAETPLAWSEELPAVQGWYWWRADDESPPVVEWVYDDYRGGPRLVVWVEAGEAPTVREKGGDWAGPIAPPAC